MHMNSLYGRGYENGCSTEVLLPVFLIHTNNEHDYQWTCFTNHPGLHFTTDYILNNWVWRIKITLNLKIRLMSSVDPSSSVKHEFLTLVLFCLTQIFLLPFFLSVRFTVCAKFGDEVFPDGSGITKRAAKEAAAQVALQALRGRDQEEPESRVYLCRTADLKGPYWEDPMSN